MAAPAQLGKPAKRIFMNLLMNLVFFCMRKVVILHLFLFMLYAPTVSKFSDKGTAEQSLAVIAFGPNVFSLFFRKTIGLGQVRNASKCTEEFPQNLREPVLHAFARDVLFDKICPLPCADCSV